MDGKHRPWTPGGKELLDTINQIIRDNGGRFAMIKAIQAREKEYQYEIMRENRKQSGRRKFEFQPWQDEMIKKYWLTHNLQEITDMIGRSYSPLISVRGLELGLPNRPKVSHRNGQIPRPIIIMYPDHPLRCESIKQATEVLNEPHYKIIKAAKTHKPFNGVIIKFA